MHNNIIASSVDVSSPRQKLSSSAVSFARMNDIHHWSQWAEGGCRNRLIWAMRMIECAVAVDGGFSFFLLHLLVLESFGFEFQSQCAHLRLWTNDMVICCGRRRAYCMQRKRRRSSSSTVWLIEEQPHCRDWCFFFHHHPWNLLVLQLPLAQVHSFECIIHCGATSNSNALVVGLWICIVEIRRRIVKWWRSSSSACHGINDLLLLFY